MTRLLSILHRPLVVYPLGAVLLAAGWHWLGWWTVALIMVGGAVEWCVWPGKVRYVA